VHPDRTTRSAAASRWKVCKHQHQTYLGSQSISADPPIFARSPIKRKGIDQEAFDRLAAGRDVEERKAYTGIERSELMIWPTIPKTDPEPARIRSRT